MLFRGIAVRRHCEGRRRRDRRRIQGSSRLPPPVSRPWQKYWIVEDDESVRTLAARALERAGHAIELAGDGAAGLARIRASGGGFDLVVSDIRMPEMDGIEMAKAAAAFYPGLRIMLVTGYADQRERAELRSIIVDVMQKPFTLAEIRERVGRALA
jgi:DNA-binding NtrC family response regulator